MIDRKEPEHAAESQKPPKPVFKISRLTEAQRQVVGEFQTNKVVENATKGRPQVLFKRVRERTIKEALSLVRRWQELIEQDEEDAENKPDDAEFEGFTVYDAAIFVGISKRSLDDYYM